MTADRLEELKKKLDLLFLTGNDEVDFWKNELDDIVSVLDSAQRIPTEEVQRAIDWIENVKVMVHGRDDTEILNRRIFSEKQSADFDLAITALKAYDPKPVPEEAQRAIDQIDTLMVREIEEWENADDEWQCEPGARHQYEELLDAFGLAITALRQMQPEQDCNECNAATHPSVIEPCKSCSVNKRSNWMPLPKPPKGCE